MPQVWCQFDDGTSPDGMPLDGDRLYVAGSVGDRVAVVDFGGRLVRSIETGAGSDPTNLCIEGGRLWIMLGLAGQLISFSL